MSTPRAEIDKLLASACSLFLRAGAITNNMRVLLASGRDDEFCRAADDLNNCVSDAGEVVLRAASLALAESGITFCQPDIREGGLKN